MEELVAKGVDAIVQLPPAESHVDRSIEDPTAFMKTNFFGIRPPGNYEKVLTRQPASVLHVSQMKSTGSLGESGAFTEETPLAPNSPYAASKTAARHDGESLLSGPLGFLQ